MKLGASDRWHFWYRWLTRVQVLAALAMSIVTVASRYNAPAGTTGLWHDLIECIQNKAIFIVVFANAALWISYSLKKYFGYPLAWDTVKVLLEEFRDDVFEGATNLTANHDRVTLFMKKDWRWRWGIWPMRDWLCAVERTGHMTRSRRKWFRACDNGVNFEGVAGATWCTGQTILKESLTIPTDHSGVESYARDTFVSTDYVRRQMKKGAPLARSLCGLIVEVDNKPWGVIVIDSSLEKLVEKERIERFYQNNAKVVGKLLILL